MLESDNELGLIEIGNGLENVANVACLPHPAACHLPDVVNKGAVICKILDFIGNLNYFNVKSTKTA